MLHNDVDVKGIEQTAPKRERSEVGSSRHNSYVIHNSLLTPFDRRLMIHASSSSF